jgi:hypothetical protein
MCDVRKSASTLGSDGIGSRYGCRSVGHGTGPGGGLHHDSHQQAREPTPATRPTPPVSRASSAPPKRPTPTATKSSAAAATCAFAAANTQKITKSAGRHRVQLLPHPKLAVVGDARGSFGNAHAITNNEYGVYNPRSTSTPSWAASAIASSPRKNLPSARRPSAAYWLGHLLRRQPRASPAPTSASGMTASARLLPRRQR